jgi:short-subunit dehydrogenase
MMSAEQVARSGFEGLMKGKKIVIPGAMNRIRSGIARGLPATFTAKIVRRMNGR